MKLKHGFILAILLVILYHLCKFNPLFEVLSDYRYFDW